MQLQNSKTYWCFGRWSWGYLPALTHISMFCQHKTWIYNWKPGRKLGSQRHIQKCKWQSYFSRNTNLFSFLQKDWFAVTGNTTDIKKETSFTQKNLLVVCLYGSWSFKGTIRQKNCLNICKITVEYTFSYDLLPSYGTFSLTFSWLLPNWSFISPQGVQWECMEDPRNYKNHVCPQSRSLDFFVGLSGKGAWFCDVLFDVLQYFHIYDHVILLSHPTSYHFHLSSFTLVCSHFSFCFQGLFLGVEQTGTWM